MLWSDVRRKEGKQGEECLQWTPDDYAPLIGLVDDKRGQDIDSHTTLHLGLYPSDEPAELS